MGLLNYLTLFSGGAFNPVSLFTKYSASGFYYNFAGSPTRTIASSGLVPMYQDQAGTKVTADGQSIGLAIDESQGAAVGADLVTNGGFDADSDWDKASGFTNAWSITGGQAVMASTSSYSPFSTLGQSSFSLSSGGLYLITFDVVAISGTMKVAFDDNSRVSNTTIGTFDSTGTKTLLGVAASGDTVLLFARNAATASVTIDNVSAKKISGNHGLQTTSAAKPTWKTGSPNYGNGDGGDHLDTGFVPTAAMTLCACFRGGSASKAICGSQDAAGPTNPTRLELDASGFVTARVGTVLLAGSTDVRGSDVVATVVYDASDVALRVNGVEVDSASFAGTISSQAMFVFAASNLGTGALQHDSRIYRAYNISTALSGDLLALERAIGSGVVTI